MKLPNTSCIRAFKKSLQACKRLTAAGVGDMNMNCLVREPCNTCTFLLDLNFRNIQKNVMELMVSVLILKQIKDKPTTIYYNMAGLRFTEELTTKSKIFSLL